MTPDGLYRWAWGGDYPGTSYVLRRGGQWIDFRDQPDHELTPPEDGTCTRVRVLGDDETAVSLAADIDPDVISALIDNLRTCGRLHHVTREILEAVKNGIEARHA